MRVSKASRTILSSAKNAGDNGFTPPKRKFITFSALVPAPAHHYVAIGCTPSWYRSHRVVFGTCLTEQPCPSRSFPPPIFSPQAMCAAGEEDETPQEKSVLDDDDNQLWAPKDDSGDIGEPKLSVYMPLCSPGSMGVHSF